MKTDIKKRVHKLKATELVVDNQTQEIEAGASILLRVT